MSQEPTERYAVVAEQTLGIPPRTVGYAVVDRGPDGPLPIASAFSGREEEVRELVRLANLGHTVSTMEDEG